MNRSRQDEYAEVYRRAYERARRGFDPTTPLATPGPTTPVAEDGPGPDRQSPRSRRRTALALGAAAVTLVVGAFGIGRMVADGGASVQPGAAAADGAAPERAGDADPQPYRGAVSTVPVLGAEASCQSPDSVDAAGNPVGYAPRLAHDRDLTTAWRCNGAGRGERLTLELPAGTRVAEVGLVPGYAKTDPADGTDRYAQNNRITAVRWHFDDGSTHLQRMDGDPDDRSMRTLRVPVTRTGTVVLEIVRSAPGPRTTVAVSEVRVAAAPAR